MTEPIRLARPDVSFDEIAEDLRTAFDTGVLTQGPFVQTFEAQLAEIIGAPVVLATSSATTALHLALAAWDIGVGDEVLVSDFTFPATGNVIVQTGATPVLVDSAPGSYSMDVDHLEALVTDRSRAVVVVDPFGIPPDLQRIRSVADEQSLLILEDAACAIGSSLEGVRCGSWAHAAAFSFHPRKILSTGEGGALALADPGAEAACRSLRTHGVSTQGRGTFDRNGFNYRLSEIAAIIGSVQARRLDAILEDRRATGERYASALGALPGVGLPPVPPGTVWNHQSYVVELDERIDRERVRDLMRSAGVETTLGTYAMHAQPAFARFGYEPGTLSRSFALQRQTLTLPLLPRMPADQVERVVHALREAIGRS